MLDLAVVDLDDLAAALEDNSPYSSWWLDPLSGGVEFWSADEGTGEIDERGLVRVDPIPTHEAYADMADFAALVPSARLRERLERAIQGRGAFRRFKDVVYESSELGPEWTAFHDRRMRRRGIEWLVGEGLVDSAAGDRALTAVDGAEASAIGADGVAQRAAEGLRALYGERLAEVVLFGSHARGEETADSDIDLLVALTGAVDPWEEMRRLDDLLWRLTLAHGITVSALPVSAEQWRDEQAPVLVEARAHGVVLT